MKKKIKKLFKIPNRCNVLMIKPLVVAVVAFPQFALIK